LRIGVRVNVSSFVGQIQKYLPPRWHGLQTPTVDRLYSFIVNDRVQRHGTQHFHLLYGNVQTLARTTDEAQLLKAFESDVNSYIAQAARTHFFVHAGVVGWKGRAIVIPGPSYSGKTTLVKEFLQHGASYYSDEFAAFDDRGHVWPFARPLGIRGRTSQEQIGVLAEELGGQTAVQGLPVGLLLFTRYQQSARWKPEEMTAGAGVLGLLANALAARQQPKRALALLGTVARGARILTGVRGDAKDVVRAALDARAT
jgi:hypothetical protein